MDCRTKRIVALLTAVVGYCFLSTVAHGENEAASIQVIHDREAFVTTINVPSRDGLVSWTDIFRGVSRARGFDDRALEDLVRAVRFPSTARLRDRSWRR